MYHFLPVYNFEARGNNRYTNPLCEAQVKRLIYIYIIVSVRRFMLYCYKCLRETARVEFSISN